LPILAISVVGVELPITKKNRVSVDQLMNDDEKDDMQRKALISPKLLKNICKIEKSPYVKIK
jgi:hypothetical protein